MAVGTFVESFHNTATARIWAYNAWWFEAIMGVFVVNFVGNIKKYRLLRWEKWPILLLQGAWILIILGAFVTRYFGVEGVLPIREGETTNTFLSEKTYVTVLVDGEMDGALQRKKLQDDFLFAEPTNNNFRWRSSFNEQKFSIEYVDFISNAAESLVEDPKGDYYIKIVESGDGNRHDHHIGFGEIVNIHNVLFTFNNPTDGAIHIEWDQTNNDYTINTPFSGTTMQMATQSIQDVLADGKLPSLSIFVFNGWNAVCFSRSSNTWHISNRKRRRSNSDALTLKISTDGVSETVQVLGAKGLQMTPNKFL